MELPTSDSDELKFKQNFDEKLVIKGEMVTFRIGVREQA